MLLMVALLLGQEGVPPPKLEIEIPKIAKKTDYHTPAKSVAHAVNDIQKIQADQHNYRYLSLYNIDKDYREQFIKVLSGHVNTLSRESDLTPVSIIKGTEGTLVRINILDYKWDRATWEKLKDPYFTVTVTFDTVWWEGGTWPDDGKFYRAGAFQYKKKKQALAPWLAETPADKDNITNLVYYTQSQVPIVRADWFFNQTAAAAERSPNYYEFLGVKDEKSFQQIIGADVKKAEEIGAEIREAVAISTVTLHPRAIVRHGTISGGYWRSIDFNGAKDERNPLRIFGKDIEKNYDASEQFGHLANGLWATGLFDKQGKIQNTAPDTIASDGMSRSTDRRVHVNVSCIRCHANNGMQDVEGWVKNLLTPPLEIRGVEYNKTREFRRQYSKRIESYIDKDRAIFEEAVKDATGMKGRDYTRAYSDEWERYEDARIGVEEAAIDLGVPTQQWRKALSNSVRAGRGDTVLSIMLLENPRLNRLPIRIWEDSYSLAYTILRGYP